MAIKFDIKLQFHTDTSISLSSVIWYTSDITENTRRTSHLFLMPIKVKILSIVQNLIYFVKIYLSCALEHWWTFVCWLQIDGPGEEVMWFDSAIHAREWLSPSTNMLMLNRVSLCTSMYSLVTCYLKSKHLLTLQNSTEWKMSTFK